MKKFFYFFLILFSFQYVFAQNTPAELAVMKEIKKVSNNEKNEYRQKEYLRLLNKSRKINFSLGILNAGSGLMTVYSRQSQNQEVLNLGDELKKTAQNEKDTSGVISQIYGKSALALFTLGLDDAGLKDLKTAIRYTKDISNTNKRYYYLGTYYENMPAYYSNSKRYGGKKYRDSILYFYNKSNEAIKKVTDNDKGISKSKKYRAIAFNNIRVAIFYLEEPIVKGNLEKAEKHLFAASKFYENKDYDVDPIEKTMMVNQFSWLYMEKKEYQKSIQYGNRALSMERQFPHTYNRMDSYEILASDYLGLGDKEKSKFYMNQYTTLKDSIRFMEKKDTDKTVKKIINNIDKNHQESSKKQLFIIGFAIFIAIIFTIFLWRRKNEIIHKKYEEIIAKIESEKELKNFPVENDEEIDNNKVKSSLMIKDEIIQNLLQGLDKFEISEKYLRKEVSLTWLANTLGTNPKYLSEVIKNYRDKNFSNYINGLRINYIIRKLYDDPKYRKYKISYLCEECGYVTQRVFLLAFKNETGFTPSYFIEQLNADQR